MSIVKVSDFAAAILGRFPFAGIDADAVASLLNHCEERRIVSGEVVCKERTHGDEMYLLVQGRVRLTRLDNRGEPLHLTSRQAPDILGALALIDNALRSATVAAEGDVVVRVLPRSVYATLWNAPTLAGSALRRLLLAALHEQLSRAHQIWTGQAKAGDGAAEPGRPGVVTITVEDEYDDELLFGLKRDITEGGGLPE